MKNCMRCNEDCPYIVKKTVDYGIEIPTVDILYFCGKDSIIPIRVRYNGECDKLEKEDTWKERILKWLERRRLRKK